MIHQTAFHITVHEAWANSTLLKKIVPEETRLNVISYKFTAIAHLDIFFITGYSTCVHEMIVPNSYTFSL